MSRIDGIGSVFEYGGDCGLVAQLIGKEALLDPAVKQFDVGVRRFELGGRLGQPRNRIEDEARSNRKLWIHFKKPFGGKT